MLAFDELYARYATRLFGFLRPQLPSSRADAEDVFHESLLATLESHEVTFDRGSFRTWLYRIARNLVLNRIRSEGRGEIALARLAPLVDDPPPAADERAAQGQMLQRARRRRRAPPFAAVGGLPPALVGPQLRGDGRSCSAFLSARSSHA